jgi:hypothetical protein
MRSKTEPVVKERSSPSTKAIIAATHMLRGADLMALHGLLPSDPQARGRVPP